MEQLNLPLEELPSILLGLCLFFLLTQLYQLLFVHGKLAFHRVKERSESSEGAEKVSLSVVVCVRNEEARLADFLGSLLEQDYPSFEVIVVNDRSEDDTKWILRDLSAQYPRLKTVEIAEHVTSQSGKKFGVAMGIKAAQHEHIVLTDVDCEISSKHWLSHLAAGFIDNRRIVLGYVPLKRKSGFLNALIRYEHFLRSVDYLSNALKGQAYTGFGQNMAFHKPLFFEGKGYAAHMHVPTGHDELFINQHASRKNCGIVLHKEAHVWKHMPDSFSDYAIQRRFRKEVRSLFKRSTKARLNWQAGTALLFYIALLATFVVTPQTWPYLFGIYGVRLLVQYAIYTPIARKLRITRMLWFLPILDVLHTFYLGLSLGKR